MTSQPLLSPPDGVDECRFRVIPESSDQVFRPVSLTNLMKPVRHLKRLTVRPSGHVRIPKRVSDCGVLVGELSRQILGETTLRSLECGARVVSYEPAHTLGEAPRSQEARTVERV